MRAPGTVFYFDPPAYRTAYAVRLAVLNFVRGCDVAQRIGHRAEVVPHFHGQGRAFAARMLETAGRLRRRGQWRFPEYVEAVAEASAVRLDRRPAVWPVLP